MIPKSFSFFQTLILVIHVLSKHTKQLLCFLRIQRLHGQKYLCWIIDAKRIMFNHRKGGGGRGGVLSIKFGGYAPLAPANSYPGRSLVEVKHRVLD